MQPGEVVLAAYGAANRGQHSIANAFIAPDFRRLLIRSHAMTVASGRQLRRTLLELKGRRDKTAAQSRKALLALIKINRTLEQIRIDSPRFLSDQWDGATRNRSLVKIEATRQVIRGSRAKVYLRLTLRDGTVVRDSEPLLLRHGKWLLGAETMTVLQAIRKAERVLPGKAVDDGQLHPRWQAILRVEDYIEQHPEEVWRFTRKWGVHANVDLRTAVATCLLERLLACHFSRIFSLVSEASRHSARFADTLSRCWALGQARRPQNLKRLRALVREVIAPSANTPLQRSCRNRSRHGRSRKSVAAPASR